MQRQGWQAFAKSSQGMHAHSSRLHKMALRAVAGLQGQRLVCVSHVACSSQGWRLCSLAHAVASGTYKASPSGRQATVAGKAGESGGSSSVLPQALQVPAGAKVAAFFHLYPPLRSGSSVTSGGGCVGVCPLCALPLHREVRILLCCSDPRATRPLRQSGCL